MLASAQYGKTVLSWEIIFSHVHVKNNVYLASVFFFQKNQELLHRGSTLEEVESKNTHLLSRLAAFEESSESQIVKRLQKEVADLEKTLRSRNLDIQILERRVRVHKGFLEPRTYM